MCLSKDRSLLREVTRLNLVDIGADGEIDIVEHGTALAEFNRLSMVAISPPAVETGTLSPEQAAMLVDRPAHTDFLACGFVNIGVWGRRPESPEA
jgi:hypothetical protein